MLLKNKLKKKVFQNNTDYFKFINRNKEKIKIKVFHLIIKIKEISPQLYYYMI